MQKSIEKFDPYAFSTTQAGPVRVYYKHLPWAPCIHIHFHIGAGAFHDPVGKEGVAHFLEHMLGNGSPLVPDRKAMKEFSRQYMLGSRNAFTSYYRTEYVGRCLPEHFEKVVTTMYDYIFHSFVRPADVEHERKVITEEAWGRYKNEKLLAYIKEFDKNMYPGHPRERIASPLGWPQTVAQISTQDLTNFYTQHYTAENLTVFVVGAVEDSHVEYLTHILKEAPVGTKEEITLPPIPTADIRRFERTGEEIGDPKKQLEFSVMRATTDISKDTQYTSVQARRLLQDILFERLRTEHSLCYGVSVGTHRYRDYFEGGINVQTSLEYLPKVETEVWQVISEICSGTWQERFSTIHQVILDQLRSTEHISEDIIGDASNEYTNRGTITTMADTIAGAEKVTHKDVVDFIRTFFDKDRVITEVIFPKKDREKA